ncbi:helix-turn-helix domain-containing protein [Kineosporia mesophila]|uniref:helix-turn-helix domain-containing protein n=1 Tax=Kineosporia mesophila TaxID=566012 RepID=UPI001E400024|nr:helix-turn-helix transcriptional regulator [Kineosporia mesophila]
MNSLGEFLAARRGRLQPADLGLRDIHQGRRVPGLRRDEVAQEAGVSTSYLTRLEQGSLIASPQVLDALAQALRLSETERLHLHTLARRQTSRGRRSTEVDCVTSEIRQLMDSFGTTPVVLTGLCADLLAWNAAGHALIGPQADRSAPDSLPTRPNVVRMVFLDPYVRALYPDWAHKARDVVGRLRLAVGTYPDDPRLITLINEMNAQSVEFAEMWSEHGVHAWDVATYRMRHPVLGKLDVVHHSLSIPHDPAMRLIVMTAVSGSASEKALRRLATSPQNGG